MCWRTVERALSVHILRVSTPGLKVAGTPDILIMTQNTIPILRKRPKITLLQHRTKHKVVEHTQTQETKGNHFDGFRVKNLDPNVAFKSSGAKTRPLFFAAYSTRGNCGEVCRGVAGNSYFPHLFD